MSTGSRVPGSWPVGSSSAVGQAAVARAAQCDPRDQAGGSRVRRHRGRPTRRARPSSPRRRPSRSCRRPAACRPRSLPECTPCRGGAGREAVRAPRPQADRLRGLARPEQHGLAVDVQHAPHLQGRRRDRDAVDDQPPGALGVGHGDRGARGGVRGHAGDDVDPDRVGALVVEGGAPVAGSTRSARSAVWSRGWTTTSRPWSSQTTSARYSSVQRIAGPPPVQGDDFGADQRVRRARRRVGDDRRVPVGVRGIGDVPALHRACRRRARRPVRRPRATTSSRASAPSPRRRRSRRARSSPRGRPVRRGCSSFPPPGRGRAARGR